MSARDQCDRLKVAFDIVRQLRHHMTGDGQRADRPHADGVTIGRRFGDKIKPNGKRTAGTIVDYDLLPKFFGQLGAENTRDSVGGTAGGLWNDESNGVIGIFRGRRRGQPPCNSDCQYECTHDSPSQPMSDRLTLSLLCRNLQCVRRRAAAWTIPNSPNHMIYDAAYYLVLPWGPIQRAYSRVPVRSARWIGRHL